MGEPPAPPLPVFKNRNRAIIPRARGDEWCERRDSNSQVTPLEPKSSASTSSATFARRQRCRGTTAKEPANVMIAAAGNSIQDNTPPKTRERVSLGMGWRGDCGNAGYLKDGGPWDSTYNQLIKSQLLYQLS